MTTTPYITRRSLVIKNYGIGSDFSDVGIDTITDGETRTQSSNPNWQYEVRHGINAARPYFRSKLTFRPASGSTESFCQPARTTVPPPDPWFSYGYGMLGLSSYQPFTSNVYGPREDASLLSIASSRIRNKLADLSKAKNVVVPLVELREFRGLIGGMSGLTTRLFTDLIARKQRGGRASDILKYASDSWLTFQFGIKPMLGDAAEIAASIGTFLNRSSQKARIVAGSPVLNRSLTGSRGPYAGPYGTVRYNVLQGDSQLSYKIIAGVSLDVSSSNNYSVANQFGLNFTALPSVLWELTPYSWAVDYFTNVGEYLDDVFSSPPGNTTYVVVDRKFSCRFTISSELRRTNLGLRYKTWSGNATGDYFEFQRTTSSSLPFPSLRFRSLDEIGRNGIFKMLNLGAVLAGRKLH